MADTVWLVGGDGRQRALGALLEADGFRVARLGLDGAGFSPERAEKPDLVLLPLPVVSSPGVLNAPSAGREILLEEVFSALSPGQLIFGGRVDGDTESRAAAHGLTLRDYFRREELIIANAVPTAEGAVQLAMEELPVTIRGCRVLVLGFGRVGKLTALRLQALGASVTVSARRYEALAWAAALGFAPVHLWEENLFSFDLVVNTIPAPVLGTERLRALKDGVLVLDLASKPGGVDWNAAEEQHIHAIHALSLPGRVAPLTAAAAIRDAVYHMLEESEVSNGT